MRKIIGMTVVVVAALMGFVACSKDESGSDGTKMYQVTLKSANGKDIYTDILCN